MIKLAQSKLNTLDLNSELERCEQNVFSNKSLPPQIKGDQQKPEKDAKMRGSTVRESESHKSEQKSDKLPNLQRTRQLDSYRAASLQA